MTDYFKELGNAWSLFTKNLNVCWFILVGFIYLIIILGIAGLLVLLFWLITGINITNIGTLNLSMLVISLITMEVIIWLILIIVLGNYMTAMFFGFLKEVCFKGKCNFTKVFDYGRRYWSTYFKYGLLYFFGLMSIPALFIAIFVILAILTSGALRILFGIIAGILVIGFIFYVIFIYFTQFFARVMIVVHNTNAVETMKKSYQYLLKNPTNVLATFGVILLISIPISIMLFIISFLELIPYVVFITTPIEQIISFILSIILVLFMIRCYCVENNIKQS